MSLSNELARTAASKLSLLSTADLSRAGVDHKERNVLLRAGELHRVRHGHYIRGNDGPTWHHEVAAAHTQLGGRGVLSHRTAARVFGLGDYDAIDLTIRYPADAKVAGVAVHRSRDIEPCDIFTMHGFQVTGLTRTLCDLGLVLPDSETERAIDHAVAADLISVSELQALRQRVGRQGRTGVVAVDLAIVGMPPDAHLTESGPELRLHKIIRQSALPDATPQLWVRALGRRYRVDLGYPDERIALEFDGVQAHSTSRQIRQDQARQRHLEATGWIVLRFKWDDLSPLNLPRTLMRIRNALQSRGYAPWRSPHPSAPGEVL